MHEEHIVSTVEEIKNGLSKCKRKKNPNKQTNKTKQTNNKKKQSNKQTNKTKKKRRRKKENNHTNKQKIPLPLKNQ